MNIELLLNSCLITLYECLYISAVMLAFFIILNTIRYAYNKKLFFYSKDHTIGMMIGVITYFFIMTSLRLFNISTPSQAAMTFLLLPFYLFMSTSKWPIFKDRIIFITLISIILALIHTTIFYK